MPNIQVGFQSTLVTSSNNFVAALYDASNVGVVLESQVIPKSGGIYPPNFQVTFLTVISVNKVYRVILWETSGTTPGGTSRVSSDIPAGLNAVNLQDALYLTADISSGFASGTNTITEPSIIGWDIVLDIPGTDTAYPGTDYTYDKTTGIITWLLGNWSPSQRAVIFPKPQISVAAPPPVSAISSGQIITASRSLTSSDKNQALYIQSAFASISLPLPALSSIADYDHITAYSAGGSHINAVFPANGSDMIQYKGLLTQLIARQGEKIDLFKANGVWNIDTKPAGMDFVGEIVDKFTKGDLNLIFADGSLLSRTLYPALWAYVQTLSSNSICSEAVWASSVVLDGITYYANKGKWTLGDGSTTFRVPQIYNSGFRRAVDGASTRFGNLQYAGIAEADMSLDHQHDSMTGLFGTKPNGAGPAKTSGTYGGTSGGQTDLSGGMYNPTLAGANGVLTARRGSETHPTNLYVFASIRI